MTVLVDPDFPPTRSESHCRCDGPAGGSAFDEHTVTKLFGPPPNDAMLVFGVAEAERSAGSA